MAGKVSAEHEEGELSWGINITPLVDVCLVLVIIFIVTAQAVLDEKLEVKLPAAQMKDKERGVHVTVTVDKDGRKTVNSQDVEEPWKENLKGMLADVFNRSGGKEGLRPEFIIVRADEGTKYGVVKEVLQVIRDTGFASAAVATRPSQQ